MAKLVAFFFPLFFFFARRIGRWKIRGTIAAFNKPKIILVR